MKFRNDETMRDSDKYIKKYLEQLLLSSPARNLTHQDRVVIFSDLHLGDGSGKDDFRKNAALFQTILKEYYLPEDFLLVLNGDIEEHQKFSPFKVRRVWESVFFLFHEFASRGKLIQLWGNHDERISLRPGKEGRETYEGFRLLYKDKVLFLFHGHQTSPAFHRINKMLGFAIRHIVRPLGIMNGSVAQNDERKFKTEQKIYEFSSERKIVSIIGHTHRPLFESLSKLDVLKIRIEELCRRYPYAKEEEKSVIAGETAEIKRTMKQLLETDPSMAQRGSIYESHFLIPCVFNSGSATGKGGITCLEIYEGKIRLIHWVDEERGKHHLTSPSERIDSILVPGYYRVVLKEESLDYIFARIELLA
jgi:UDP-2,3-diacylglucosamine pyrophosphatase LpxH